MELNKCINKSFREDKRTLNEQLIKYMIENDKLLKKSKATTATGESQANSNNESKW